MGRRRKKDLQAGQTRVIKRYGNRKLYDTQQSRYVTLEEISQMIRQGQDVRVVDNKSQEDLTNVTLTQIMLEHEKNKTNLLPHSLLKNLIQQSGESISEWLQRGKESFASMKTEAEEQISRLLEKGMETKDEGASLLREWLVHPHRPIDLLQKKIDERIKFFFFHLTGLEDLERQIQELEQKVVQLEKRLSES
ncbi:MAG: polyhydroxyalkanoate synthesis regulator DNA-binding domain-containing protein [bacterium]